MERSVIPDLHSSRHVIAEAHATLSDQAAFFPEVDQGISCLGSLLFDMLVDTVVDTGFLVIAIDRLCVDQYIVDVQTELVCIDSDLDLGSHQESIRVLIVHGFDCFFIGSEVLDGVLDEHVGLSGVYSQSGLILNSWS